MLDFIKKIFLRPRDRERILETDEGKLFQKVALEDICPDCGNVGFYEGPRGGINVNLFCTNRDCRSGFNVAYFDDRSGMCDRIHKGNINAYPKE